MAVVEKTIDIIGDEAFSNLIVSKTIPEGVPVDFYDDVVASFRSFALYRHTQIQSLNFPKVTSCATSAMQGCTSLKRVEMAECKSMTERVLQDCPALEYLYLPKLQTTGICFLSVNGDNGTFPLTELNFPELTTLGELALNGRASLTSLIFPKLKYVYNYGFSGCMKMKQIDLPSIETIGAYAFSSCGQLEVVNFGPNIRSINGNMLKNAREGLVINFPFEEGSISGAPWGGIDVVFNYGVPYSGDVPMPT